MPILQSVEVRPYGGYDPESQTLVRLFHPRKDRWDAHFVVDPDSGAIHGRTPTARATIDRLHMNGEAQRTARCQWMRLGLFP